MDELITFLTRTNDLWDHHQHTRRTDIDVSELCYRQQDITVRHRVVERDGIEAWLNNTHVFTSTAPSQPCFLRIVWIKQCINEQTDDIAAATLTRILDAFELKTALAYSRTSFASVTVLPSNTTNGNNKQAFGVSIHPKLNLLWSYNSTTGTTSAICFETQSFIDNFKIALDAKWSFSMHPMFPAFICSIILANEIDRDQNAIKHEVREVEVRTGFHRWTGRPERPASGDLSVLSAQMSGCSTKMASVERKTSIVREVHRLILEQSEKYDTPAQIPILPASSPPLPPAHSPSSDQKQSDTYNTLSKSHSTSSLDQLLLAQPSKHQSDIQSQPQLESHPRPSTSPSPSTLNTTTHHLSHRLTLSTTDTTFIRARITSQLTALAHLITQNDTIASQSVAQDSRTLAIASHRDSSSMKTLAVVTMFFLPGTFVASLFAMPFFGVDATRDRVRVVANFGVYWAVTVPLTVVVVGIWVFWTLWRGWRDERVDRRERTRVRRELAGKGVRSVGSWVSEKSGGGDWMADVDGVADGGEEGLMPEIGSLVRKRTALERQKTR